MLPVEIVVCANISGKENQRSTKAEKTLERRTMFFGQMGRAMSMHLS
jgi:hypothetical protein